MRPKLAAACTLLVFALTPGSAPGQPAELAECMELLEEVFEGDAAHDADIDRIDTLCAAGDRDGAAALAQALEDQMYAGPQGARLRECMEAVSDWSRSQLAAVGIERHEADDEETHICDF